jgi:hypothetical protein
VRLVRVDEFGCRSKCRHEIGLSNEKLCMAEKAGDGVETCGVRHHGEEVALEANACYIRIARNQILARPFLPCAILAEDYLEELLADSKELVDWQTLFADIIRTAEDSNHATVDARMVGRWQDNLRLPLRTPGRIRPRLLLSPADDSEISADARTPGVHIPDTPEVDLNFSVDPETYEAWAEVGLPVSLVTTLQAMEQGLDKANVAILGLHRDFGAMVGVMSDDVHALDCRVERLQTSVGLPKPVPGVMAGNVWEALAAVAEGFAMGPSSSVGAIDIQTRLGSLAASATLAQREVEALRVEKNVLSDTVVQLELQLATTLEITLNLRARVDRKPQGC